MMILSPGVKTRARGIKKTAVAVFFIVSFKPPPREVVIVPVRL
ncbi:hypothetical protein EDWATA_02636 [Edwardsiella tarda ATCC 23685]|uniref:Uncharacterized protein n=1 Tax=Edwardsiella tarda ATCC 23685 TaxID=500638 RepID=D4F7A2_EDWTA|nr:hypothetical protein EDWATA_02636 [Edwardsiella tarda ATCC 23685]